MHDTQKTHMAVNHNGRSVCKPTTEAKASAHASDYTWATGNYAHVILVKDAPEYMNAFQMAEIDLEVV